MIASSLKHNPSTKIYGAIFGGRIRNKGSIVVRTQDDRYVNEKFGIKCYDNITEACKAQSIDAAIISTSPLSHAAIIKECLTYNLHVFTEINLVSDGYEENMNLAKKSGKRKTHESD